MRQPVRKEGVRDSMIPVDEFYSLPEDRQSELVREGHVAVDGTIATSIPDTHRDIHIFEDTVENKIIQILKRGHYTVDELVDELPLKKRVVTSIVSELRHRPQHLLADYHSVVRVTGTDGASYVYTIEPLPFEVRVWDPTLFHYLLANNDSIELPDFPSDKISWTTGRDEFVAHTGEYWGLPESELPDDPYRGISFVQSTLGPLPMSIPDNNSSVKERVRDVEGAYKRRKFDEDNIKRSISYFKSLCRRNPSLAAFQSYALYLYDLGEYITSEGERRYQALLQGGIKLFCACLFGGYRPREVPEWQQFKVDRTDELTQLEDRVVDIVELQPVGNSTLSDRWGVADGSAVHRLLTNELSRYATRNTDNYVCATESALRYIKRLEKDGKVTLSKAPPHVPNQAKTVFK